MRKDILEKINDILLDEGVHDPSIFKAVFLAGGPGSGKSYVASKLTGGHGLKLVNSDDAFEHLMKRAKMDLNMVGMTKKEITKKDKIRAKAKTITAAKKAQYIDGRLGLVIDGTGRDFHKIAFQKEQLNELGYDTYMIFVNTSLDVALERNASRARKVDEKLVKKFWQDVQTNMGKFQALFTSSNFKIIDNSTFVTDEKIWSKAWKEVMKFARDKIINPIAKAWIESELEKRKR